MTRSLDIGVYGARGIPSTYSGYETFLTVLLPELARRGHRVTVYCRRTQFSDDTPYGGVRRVLLPALDSFQFETLSHGLPASVTARIRRHDVVLVVNIANVPYCLAARASGQRIVLNTDGQEWERGKWGKAARAYWRGCARAARLAASALIADCQAMADLYQRQFGGESSVIPYCWTGLEPAGDPAEALAALGVERYRYFVVAARLNPENSVADIAAAYAASAAPYPLVVLGTANYASPVAAALQHLARQCPGIRLAGHVEDRRLFATLLAYSSAYLHGHRVGGLNPSLIEALGSGANVIALDTPFNREAIGDAGECFSDFDRELPRLLRAAAASPAPAGAAGRERARRRAREVFAPDAVADAYERLFVEVSGRGAWDTTTVETRWGSE